MRYLVRFIMFVIFYLISLIMLSVYSISLILWHFKLNPITDKNKGITLFNEWGQFVEIFLKRDYYGCKEAIKKAFR